MPRSKRMSSASCGGIRSCLSRMPSAWRAKTGAGARPGAHPAAPPPVQPERVEEAIEDAFRREAEVDARHVRVEVSDHTARLYGHVHSLKEASAARAAAAAAPGVAMVESHLLISP